MSKKSFTLIELLVVIAIIGILAGILIVSMNSATNFANDSRRKADINQIVYSLLIYGTSNNSTYPVSSTCNIGDSGASGCSSAVNTALGDSVNARDPIPGLYYTYWSDGTNFVIGSVLSDSSNYIYNLSSSNYSVNNFKTSCKAILDSGLSTGSGMYYIDPNGGDPSDNFQVYCDMVNDEGGWMLVTSSMIQNETSNLVTANKSADANGGLIVVAQPTAADCVSRYYRVLFKDVISWTQIRADYEFYQGSACWGIFGNSGYSISSNLIAFVPGVDTIRNQVGMGVSTDNFDGISSRCDNETAVNFWHHKWYSGGALFTRKAQVILRRSSMSSVAGLSTGINCSWNLSSGWAYKNIYIR